MLPQRQLPRLSTSNFEVTEDGEEHEYLNASYTLDFTDKISILSLDLGEFAGVHKYILLTDTEGHMLYIAVDSTNENITHRDEKQYRFLYQDDFDNVCKGIKNLVDLGIYPQDLWNNKKEEK